MKGLTERQNISLNRLAKFTGIKKIELIRRAIDEYINKQPCIIVCGFEQKFSKHPPTKEDVLKCIHV